MDYKKSKVTCRPCKEQHNWEIETPDGEVLNRHYATKEACVRAGKEYAQEYGCELCVEDDYMDEE